MPNSRTGVGQEFDFFCDAIFYESSQKRAFTVRMPCGSETTFVKATQDLRKFLIDFDGYGFHALIVSAFVIFRPVGNHHFAR